ncbi:hypothetical protein JCM11641_003401 [Rhodosporidiobolus odoratus]
MADLPSSSLSASLISSAEAGYHVAERLSIAQATFARGLQRYQSGTLTGDERVRPPWPGTEADYTAATFVLSGSAAVAAWVLSLGHPLEILYLPRHDTLESIRPSIANLALSTALKKRVNGKGVFFLERHCLGYGTGHDQLEFTASIHTLNPISSQEHLEQHFPPVTLKKRSSAPICPEPAATARLARGLPLLLILLKSLHQASGHASTPASVASRILVLHIFVLLAESSTHVIQTNLARLIAASKEIDLLPFKEALVWCIDGGLQAELQAREAVQWLFSQDYQRHAGHRGVPRNPAQLQKHIARSLEWVETRIQDPPLYIPTSPQPRSSTHPPVFRNA